MNMKKDSVQAPIPAGFAPLQRSSPYADLLGPLYVRRDGALTVTAMRVEEKHANARGIAHGGMLASLADSALSIGLTVQCDGRHAFVTASLSTDFVDAARPGDWIEAEVDVQRMGRRMAFANCCLKVGEKCIVRASGVFATMNPASRAKASGSG